jgi:AcrR family transcriptional regulator
LKQVIDTKQKILNTAERLIGEQGYSATSLRQIIGAAGVNLAAVHYHFGSKEELLDEVILRKAGPVNAERLARLDRLQDAAAPPTVTEILEAFLEPMAAAADNDPAFVHMMGRIMSEGLLQMIVQKHFQVVVRRVHGALRQALPWLPEDEFLWRTHFMIGAMAHTMCGQPDTTGKGGASGTFRERIERLIAFLSGGFEAPVPESSLSPAIATEEK